MVLGAGVILAGADEAHDTDPRLARSGEVIRAHVLELLDHRWDRAITTVVAGAGFGKSMSIAQAMRANGLAPRGVEGRVTARWGCEDAVRFVTSAAEALDATMPPRGSPLARLQSVVADRAPLAVCLIVDDAETLSHGAVNLLGALVDAMPTNLHLVLVGRSMPPLGMARLRAADQLLEIGADDLRFRPHEVQSMADALGATTPSEHLGGWPALIRLSLAAPDRGADDFLWEEVIRTFSDEDRLALQALGACGRASVAEIEQVTRRALDVDGFCERVPLVSREGDQLVAHDLWRPFLADLGPAGSFAGVRDRAVRVVTARGDVVTSGQVAMRLEDDAALCTAARDLVTLTLGALPADIAGDWLASASPEARSRPEMRLLEAALTNSRSSAEPSDESLDAIVEAFHESLDVEGEAAALALCTIVADSRRDLDRLLALSFRAGSVATEHPQPLLDLLNDAVGAATAMLAGEIGRGLSLLDRPDRRLPPGLRPEAAVRLHWRLLLLAGRAADAAAIVGSFDPDDALAGDRPLHEVAQWMAGDGTALDPKTVELGSDRYEGLTERDRFDQAAFVAVMAASVPDPAPVDLAVQILEASPFAALAGPDGALLAVARAAHRCVHHDDEGARHEIARFVDRAEPEGLTDAELRRSLGIPYVCSPELRKRWDAMDLGPSQRLTRAIARMLVDARDGACPADPAAPLASVVTALPWPWSIELASRAAAAGRRWGIELASDLADRFEGQVAPALAWLIEHGDAETSRGATAIRAELPAAPPHELSIVTLGPLAVHRDGDPVDAPALRRVRVRELLSVLVLERSVARDRVIELLWPDQDPAKGRANLRVTLAHLLDALEPGRERRSPTYFVRATQTHLSLPRSSSLHIDLWEVERLLAEADRAADSGDSATRGSRLTEAVAMWHGRVLSDLDGVAELSDVGSRVERRLVDAALTLGELELVAGVAERAGARAERVLAADQYDERAHRLAIAARLQAGDRSGAREVIDRLRRTLDDLGLEPDDATTVLLRQAERAERMPA